MYICIIGLYSKCTYVILAKKLSRRRGAALSAAASGVIMVNMALKAFSRSNRCVFQNYRNQDKMRMGWLRLVGSLK